eukprot:TRINITY_DN3954_c0_g2_i4.p2 TRINITY_DN3954_c0_g2~~TRINITY_DN3954_c0_g2_i4.p2  ORF type:complete len:220 (-),score=81.96 TRINITY_DN3954_c0_g2_i4:170-829(-)
MESEDYFFKLIVLGASGVGKSCILKCYDHNTFADTKHKTTLGFDFITKTIEKGGKKIELEIWDTAGQDQYRSVTKIYYKEAHGVILVYDITDKDSFAALRYWLDDLEMHGNKLEQRVIVGNKIDRETDREVSSSEAKRFAGERKLELIECSAKTGQGIAQVFSVLLDKIMHCVETDPDYQFAFNRDKSLCKMDSEQKKGGMKYKLNKKKIQAKRKEGCC